MKGIAAGVAIPIIAAFLVELPLYLLPLFAGARAAAGRIGRWRLAGGLAVTALVPYLVYTVPLGLFDAFDFYRLTGLVLSLAFFYMIFPAAIWSDLLFLAAPAAVMITKVLKLIYPTPLPRVPLDILGHLMLIHLAAIAVLVLRGLQGVKPGLIPTRREAWIGTLAFLLFLPAGLGLAWFLHVKARPVPLSPWYAIPLFAGYYPTVTFSEEFAFRGILQQHLSRLLGSWTGLVAASILFGLSHLNFGKFPNWNLAILAGASGLFNGWAYRETGSIRASMLTHALTAVVWTIWLR